MNRPLTVSQVVALYLDNLATRVAADDYSIDAEKLARIRLTAFAKRFGDQTVADCKQHDLSTWLAENPAWKAVDTRRGAISIVTACFSFAFAEELIERNPYHRPRVLRGKTSRPRPPATAEEYCLLMRHGSRPLRRILFMLRRSGLRTCEARELCWDEVFLDGPVPYISLSRHKSFRKTGLPRIIGLDPSTARFLRNLARQYERRCNCACEICLRDIDPHVFTNCRGEPWSRHTLCRHFRRVAKSIGLDDGIVNRVTAYGLRHLYTVNAIEAGISSRQIADVLGHQGTHTVDRVYGCSTRQRVEHLASVATEINRKRNRKPHK